jgi:hypothetical protein
MTMVYIYVPKPKVIILVAILAITQNIAAKDIPIHMIIIISPSVNRDTLRRQH